MTTYTHEQLVAELQEGHIDYLDFVMKSEELRDDYITWCREHFVKKEDATAEFFLEQTLLTAEEQQWYDAEPYSFED